MTGNDDANARLAAVPLLLGAAVLTASWLRSDLPSNDFERFDDLRLTFLFFALLGGACLAYASLALSARPMSGRVVAAGFAGAALVLLAAYPVGSKDVLLYAFTGRIWGTYGANPYVAAPASFGQDPLRAFVDVGWGDKPSPYGPLFLWQAGLAERLAGGSFLAAVWIHKAIATAALAAAVAIAGRLLPAGSARLVLIAWNPLLLFESAGSGHNDAIMLLLVAAAAWLHQRGGSGRLRGVPAVLALAFWYKWYALLFVPAFALAVAREEGAAGLRRWLLAAAALGTGIGVVVLAPLWQGLPALAERLIGHEALRDPLPLQFSPVLRLLFEVLSAAGAYEGGRGWFWFDAVRLALFAAGVAAALLWQARGRLTLPQSIALQATVFAMLVYSTLWPWHLQLPAYFALLCEGPGFLWLGVGLTLVGLLSYFFTFAWATAALLAVAGALALLRRARGPAGRGMADA